jgi:hypothetical protein
VQAQPLPYLVKGRPRDADEDLSTFFNKEFVIITYGFSLCQALVKSSILYMATVGCAHGIHQFVNIIRL